jgi:hypothetical protein
VLAAARLPQRPWLDVYKAETSFLASGSMRNLEPREPCAGGSGVISAPGNARVFILRNFHRRARETPRSLP